MAQQANDRRKQALIDVKAVLAGITDFREVSYTLKSPDQVIDFPAAYVVGGGGPRTPRDLQQVYFDHEMTIHVFIYVKESQVGQLALELETLLRKVVDKIDQQAQTLKITQAYDLYVAGYETDLGTLAMEGMLVAVGELELRALLPARDEAA